MKKLSFFTLLTILLIEVYGWYTSISSVQYIEPNDMKTLCPIEDYIITGYDVHDYEFVPAQEDPQLLFNASGLKIRTIAIQFRENLEKETHVQVYYEIGQQGMSEENSISQEVDEEQKTVVFAMPDENFQRIRVDIDGAFELENIEYSASTPRIKRDWTKLLIEWVITILICVFTAIFYQRENAKAKLSALNLLPHRQKSGQLSKVEVRYLISIFFIYCIWAILFTDSTYGPDEMMRYDIPKFIFENGALPKGWEESIRNPYWGVSYGFSISLPYLISALSMKIVSIFTVNQTVLLIAARFTSVLSMVGVGYYAIKITNRLKLGQERWIFILLLNVTPQAIFLSSYVNLDSFSLLTVMMIVYAWICNLESKWNKYDCIRLGIAIGLCFLSYKFAYSFILGSVLLYCIWYIMHRRECSFRNFVLKGTLIAGVALGISGWYFIRNAIIYNGDFLSLHASAKYAELYAVAEQKPSIKQTFQNQGYSILDMLRQTTWIKSTAQSSVSTLGYMSIVAPNWVYQIYQFLCAVGLVGAGTKLVQCVHDSRKRYKKDYVVTFMLISAVVTIIISLYYSWSSDYQPQGRYIIAALPAAWWIVTSGFSCIAETIALKLNGCEAALKRTGVMLIGLAIGTTSIEAFVQCLQTFVH